MESKGEREWKGRVQRRGIEKRKGERNEKRSGRGEEGEHKLISPI